MQNNRLEILVTAKDAASDVIAGVGKSFGHLSDAAVTGSKAMLAGVAVAGAAVVAFGKQSVDAYFGAAEASAKLATNLLNVKGNTQANVDSLEQLASKLQSVGVIEDDVIKAGMSQLATFNLQSSTIATLTPKIADMATQLYGYNVNAEQMAQINNLVGKAMTGSTGALTRYGVTLSDAQAQIIQTGNEEQRAAMITEVLGQNFGKVNEALRKTPQGMFTAIQNDLGDLQEELGQLILTAIMPLAQAFSDWIAQVNAAGGFVSYFTDLINNNKDTVATLAGALTAMLLPAIVNLVVSAAPMIGALALLAAIGAILGPVINNLVQKFGGWGKVMDVVKAGFDTAVEGVKGLIASFQSGKSDGDGFVGWMSQAGVVIRQIWEGIKATGIAVWNAIKMAIDFLMPSFKALWDTIQNQLWPALQNLWNIIQPYIIPTLQVLGAIIGVVVTANIWIFVNVLNVVIGVITAVINVIAWLIQALVSIITWVIEAGIAIGNAFTTAYNTVTAVFAGIGAWFAARWAEITAVFAGVGAWFAGVWQGAVNNISNIFWGVVGIVRGVWNSITGIFGQIGSFVSNAIGGAVKGAFNGAITIAENAINGFINMINGAIGIINKIPGVSIGKIGTINLPRFASGVNNFGGGLAVVGENGPEVVNLPRGANVVGNHQLSGLGGGSVHIEIHGNIVNETPEAADRFMDRLNRMATLNEMGVAV